MIAAALDNSPANAEPGPARAATRRKREDLARIARLRARVARTSVAQREAELLASVEQQLSAQYAVDAPVWSEITTEAKRAVTAADEELAARCRELGIPEEFRPSLNIGWYGRGERPSQSGLLESIVTRTRSMRCCSVRRGATKGRSRTDPGTPRSCPMRAACVGAGYAWTRPRR